jgi:hypothetical protein
MSSIFFQCDSWGYVAARKHAFLTQLACHQQELERLHSQMSHIEMRNLVFLSSESTGSQNLRSLCLAPRAPSNAGALRLEREISLFNSTVIDVIAYGATNVDKSLTRLRRDASELQILWDGRKGDEWQRRRAQLKSDYTVVEIGASCLHKATISLSP